MDPAFLLSVTYRGLGGQVSLDLYLYLIGTSKLDQWPFFMRLVKTITINDTSHKSFN